MTVQKIGIEQKLGKEGRLQIPLAIRQKMNLKSGDKLIINYDEETGNLIVTATATKCAFCAEEQELTPLLDRYICKNCLSKLKERKGV